MKIIAEDTRGKVHIFPRPEAKSVEERTEALHEFWKGLKQGEWFMDSNGWIISPVHIIKFAVED